LTLGGDVCFSILQHEHPNSATAHGTDNASRTEAQ
jgi:hypothetical protein